ncbi:hypothetical protein LR48_Vigan07g206000 [Vigna angularis]|uniref:CTP synthase n=1 Tax=Phaseolus angularis TaxID=3914 RepID=A0A0L9V076_PHAAN|nr:hypothetical protein LR48_Vigan07g206000 [Vigna angularis]
MGNKTIEIDMPPELTCKTATTTLYVCHRDICEIVIGNDLLSTTVLQLWNLYLHHLCIERRNATIYRFLDPVIIQTVGNKSEEVQKYLIEMFEKAGKEVYLAPYLHKGHWQLLVIVPDRSLVVLIYPYLNTDAGTMSPFEHAEVFVLDDSGEVDLDLGNYERFLDIKLTGDNNITTRKMYQVRIPMVGKYTSLSDAYLYVLKGVDGVLVPRGFGDGGVQGKILATKYAGEHSVPFLGICLGMQIVVNE